jgi:hypothetical protein
VVKGIIQMENIMISKRSTMENRDIDLSKNKTGSGILSRVTGLK